MQCNAPNQPTFVSSSTDIAQKNGTRIPGGFLEEISAIRAENQRPNCRHIDSIVYRFPVNLVDHEEKDLASQIFCCRKDLLGPLTALA